MRNKLFNPFVLDDELMPTPVPTGDVGGRTGQSSPDTEDPYPCDFSTWSSKFASDWDDDGDRDMNDYMLWWVSFGGTNGFTDEAWSTYNSVPLEPQYPGGL